MIEDKKDDQEMISLAEKELKEAELKKKNEKKLKIFLLPKDKDDEKNTIVEIRASTGGLEATLFADLFRMYEKVCSKKSWKIEIISISKSEAGGFKEVIFSVTGENIYSYLKYDQAFIEFKSTFNRSSDTSAATVAILQKQKMLI